MWELKARDYWNATNLAIHYNNQKQSFYCLMPSQGIRSYVDLQAQMIFINPNQEINVELHPKYTMHATSVVAFKMQFLKPNY